jgi:hypothetical protein
MSDWIDAPTTARVGGTAFHAVESPTAAVVERMEQEPEFARKVRFAFIALTDDPGCIEAHLFLAEHTEDERRARTHLEKAVATGRQLWEPVAAAQDDFAYWGVTATRPFMRALAALGDWHADQGDEEAAQEIYDELLAKNPADSQGVRFRAAELAGVTAPGM